MKDGVKAGGWEKLETSPPPHASLLHGFNAEAKEADRNQWKCT